jgi:hypothetical protein
MLRGDSIVCGTTTTGTGILTLAATPAAVGGIDFDVFARATGIGFGNSAAIIVSYTIVEYTSSTPTVAKGTEKGVGVLTLGGSSGIANCTLARTTLQTTATSLNSQPATQNIAPATAYSIGTAANTLIFIGASADEIPAFSPYVGSVGDNLGACPMHATAPGSSGTITSGTIQWVNIVWAVPMLAKRMTVYPATAYSGGSPVSNADGRLYDIGTDGRPGKLLYDFGLFGSAGTSLNSSSVPVSTGAAGNGYFMAPGDYWVAFLPVVSGGSSGPTMETIEGYVKPGRASTNYMVPYPAFTSTGGAIGAAPDPAVLTGWAGVGNNNYCFAFTFASV